MADSRNKISNFNKIIFYEIKKKLFKR